MKARGEGFFAAVKTRLYDPPGVVIGQTHRDSCVAACCRMLLSDGGLQVGETYIRAALEVDAEGAYLSAAVLVLSELGVTKDYLYRVGLSTYDLRAAVQRGSAMVFLKDNPQTVVGHSVIVDSFSSDRVCIRDPWPLASGSSYEVGMSDFEKAWLVFAEKAGFTGQAVVIG